MGLEAKDGLTGITSPTYEKAVSDETRKKGHPLFWKETLDVEWLVAAFSDLHATRIFDLCAGSGAAACAAAVLDIPYEGIAMNAKHAAWLNNIMDRAIFAILQLREVPKDSKGHRDPMLRSLRKTLCCTSRTWWRKVENTLNANWTPMVMTS